MRLLYGAPPVGNNLGNSFREESYQKPDLLDPLGPAVSTPKVDPRVEEIQGLMEKLMALRMKEGAVPEAEDRAVLDEAVGRLATLQAMILSKP